MPKPVIKRDPLVYIPRHKFKKGQKPPPGAGRPKGSQNKLTVTVREAVKIAFDDLGGAEGLITWAMRSDKNMTAFYTLCGKLIPHQIEGGDPAKPVLLATVQKLRMLPEQDLEVLMRTISKVVTQEEADREGFIIDQEPEYQYPKLNGSGKPRIFKHESERSH